jgi:hypothetical protein
MSITNREKFGRQRGTLSHDLRIFINNLSCSLDSIYNLLHLCEKISEQDFNYSYQQFLSGRTELHKLIDKIAQEIYSVLSKFCSIMNEMWKIGNSSSVHNFFKTYKTTGNDGNRLTPVAEYVVLRNETLFDKLEQMHQLYLSCGLESIRQNIVHKTAKNGYRSLFDTTENRNPGYIIEPIRTMGNHLNDIRGLSTQIICVNNLTQTEFTTYGTVKLDEPYNTDFEWIVSDQESETHKLNSAEIRIPIRIKLSVIGYDKDSNLFTADAKVSLDTFHNCKPHNPLSFLPEMIRSNFKINIDDVHETSMYRSISVLKLQFPPDAIANLTNADIHKFEIGDLNPTECRESRRLDHYKVLTSCTVVPETSTENVV